MERQKDKLVRKSGILTIQDGVVHLKEPGQPALARLPRTSLGDLVLANIHTDGLVPNITGPTTPFIAAPGSFKLRLSAFGMEAFRKQTISDSVRTAREFMSRLNCF